MRRNPILAYGPWVVLLTLFVSGLLFLPVFAYSEPFQDWLYQIDLYADRYPTPTPTRTPMGVIDGQVLDADQQPLEDVEVRLVGMGLNLVSKTRKNDGYYRFSVPPGTYQVSTVKQFFEPTSETRTIDADSGAWVTFNRKNITPTWTLMFYLAADNNLDHGSMLTTLSYLDYASINPYVNVVVFLDGMTTPASYTHYRAGRNDDVTLLSSDPNTGDAQTLKDFIRYAVDDFPASRYALIINDHGHGMSGVAVDKTATGGIGTEGDYLTVSELKNALATAPHLDVLFMNTCLMATIDAALELSPYADYYVASQAVIWLYDKYLYIDNSGVIPPLLPQTTARDLAINMARAYRLGLETHPDPLNQHPGTISVMELGSARSTAQQASNLAQTVRISMTANLNALTQIGQDVQRFEEGFLLVNFPDRFADLYDFADKLAQRSPTDQVRAASESLKAEVGKLVVYYDSWNGSLNKQPVNYANSRGVSVIFPVRPDHLLCYYRAEWLEFAGPSNWKCQGQSAATDIIGSAESFEWGGLLADFVHQSNSDPVEIWNPPAPVAPLSVSFRAYLPSLYGFSSSPYVPTPTAVPNIKPTPTHTPVPFTPTPTRTPVPTATPSSTGLPSSTPTSTATPTLTPTPTLDPSAEMLIPAGSFQMGCDVNNPAENGCSDSSQNNEVPLHLVNLSGYYIDKYEVTNARYKACENSGYCSAPANPSSSTRSFYYGNDGYANYPVVNITWHQARAFCEWEGKRLPTEAEWEKAARGSIDTRRYPWGNEAPNCTRANYGSCVGDTTIIGAYPGGASPYGVLDMAGNAWEWVNDWFDSSYYSQSPSNDPQGPTTGVYRLFRGGTWYWDGLTMRSNRRLYNSPDYTTNEFGFRCARTAPSFSEEIYVSAGTFQMGCDGSNLSESCFSNEHHCILSTWMPTTSTSMK